MAEYRTVEGLVSTVDTLTALTTFGAETAVGPIKVPAGASRIVEIWATIAAEIEDSEVHSYVLRLSGKGMTQGDQDFGLGAGAGNGTIVLGTALMAVIYPVDLSVVANETISVQAMVAGSALAADAQATITLVFA